MPNQVKLNDLTNFVILYFKNNGIPLSPLKLQKILYYIQAWHLVFFNGHPLFDEQPEAWVNGPVYPSVYKRFKKEWLSDNNLSVSYSGDDAEKTMQMFLQKMLLEPEQTEFLFAVLQKYGKCSAAQLVYLTHAESPWNDARNGLSPFDRSNNCISFESMKTYYDSRRKGNG